MAKGAPEQPDPERLISQQSMANRVNTFSPFGNVMYSDYIDLPNTGRTDDLPRTMRIELSPAQQKILQQSQQAQQLLGKRGIQLAQRFPGRPMGQFAPGDFEAARGAAERAVFDRGMSLLNPQFELQEERLRQRLANQGLPQASQAFNAEMGRFETGRGEQMDRLAQAAVLQGLQAQQQGFGQGLATHQAQQAQRAGQLQEVLGLFGLQPVQMPQMAQVPQVDIPFQQGGGGGGPSPIGMGLSGGLSGAATGAMIGSAFGPGPGTAIGAGLGGLLGLGSGLFM